MLSLLKRGNVYYLRGTVRGISVYETTGTQDRSQAEAIRAKREAQLLDQSIFGARAVVTFARATLSYLEHEPRSPKTVEYADRLVKHFGETKLMLIDQAAADEAVRRIVGAQAAPATKRRGVLDPLIAILNHAAKRGWCDAPKIEKPRLPRISTHWLTVDEAERLVAGAAPHLRPLLVFILGTGARLAEALDLDWRDVDLPAGKVAFRDTKNGRDRIARLPPATVAALGSLPKRQGAVFLRDDGLPYADRERLSGGQIRTAWRTACRRAKLGHFDGPEPREGEKDDRAFIPAISPHDLRHTWASWFYASSRDLLLLKDEGGWQTLSMVERYAHLCPSSIVAEIPRMWGGDHPRIMRANPVQIAAIGPEKDSKSTA